jgi:transposase-like protein
MVNKTLDVLLASYSPKYPTAMNKLEKDREELLAFQDFPAEYRESIRTTNLIESAFATVRLRRKWAKIAGREKPRLRWYSNCFSQHRKLKPTSGI